MKMVVIQLLLLEKENSSTYGKVDPVMKYFGFYLTEIKMKK